MISAALAALVFAGLLAVVLLVNRPERDRSYLTEYSATQLDELSGDAAIEYLLPEQAPAGIEKDRDYNGDPPFNLADVTGQPRSADDPYWRTQYSGSGPQGEVLVVQRRNGSALEPCLDWSTTDYVTGVVEPSSDTTVTICAAPGETLSDAAKSYWGSVTWTNNFDDASWLRL